MLQIESKDYIKYRNEARNLVLNSLTGLYWDAMGKHKFVTNAHKRITEWQAKHLLNLPLFPDEIRDSILYIINKVADTFRGALNMLSIVLDTAKYTKAETRRMIFRL